MIKNPFPEKFIAIEGLDGAGKSTQAALLGDYCAKHGGKVFLTEEPSRFLTGGIIRSRLQNEWSCSPECLQLLFAADRAQHLEKEITPRLKRNISVISDRYFMSSLAYGAVDCDMEWLTQINSRFLVPDVTIYLDVSAAICARRLVGNGKSAELFEKVEILEIVRQNYQKAIKILEDRIKIIVIDGSRDKTAVSEDIFASVYSLVHGKNSENKEISGGEEHSQPL